MRKQMLLVVAEMVLLGLFLGTGPTLAQGPSGTIAQAALGPGFTYQGQLKDSAGNPISNTCDFRFSLWDAASNGTQVGADSTVPGVQAANGYFTALVNSGGEFGGPAFTGEARWLQIAVKCAGDPDYTTLSPRQALTAAPYALSLRPGARIEGAMVGADGLTVVNTADHGMSYGLYGRSDSTAGVGVFGNASVASGASYGVYGQSYSVEGAGLYGTAPVTGAVGVATYPFGATFGVYGLSVSPQGFGVYGGNTATSGTNAGVFGRSASSQGVGVYGIAPVSGTMGFARAASGVTYGVYGEAVSPSGIGVFGKASASSGMNNGVWGETNSTQGIGVVGIAWASEGGTFGVWAETLSPQGIAVSGRAAAASGSTIGVFGTADSPTGYGVYGSAAMTGMYGLATDTLGDGVYGSGGRSGVRGTSPIYGVFGHSSTTTGTGVYGESSATEGITYGVYGRTSSPGEWGAGERLSAGVYGESTSSLGTFTWSSGLVGKGLDTGVFARGGAYGLFATTGSTTGWAGYFQTTFGHGVYITAPIDKVGLNVAGGSKNAVVRSADGARLLYSEEATEVWFADYGFGELQDGLARVAIDPVFAQTVNLEEGYHVYVTALGDEPVLLYVPERTSAGFIVRGVTLDGRPASGAFDYRIVARRLGFEGQRLERAPWADMDPNLFPERQGELQNGRLLHPGAALP